MFSSIPVPCTVDIVFYAMLLIALIVGSVRGASGEIARLVSLVCGAAATYFAYKFFKTSFGVGSPLSFCAAFVIAILIVVLTHRIIRHSLRLVLGQPADALTGAVMALIGAFIVFAVLLCGATMFVPKEMYDENVKDSHANKLVHPLIMKIYERQEEKRD